MISVKCQVAYAGRLTGADDEISTRWEGFEAEELLGAPPDQIVETLAPGGHIGLFMGARTVTCKSRRRDLRVGAQLLTALEHAPARGERRPRTLPPEPA